MTDVLEELREKALLLQSEAWRRQDGGQDLLISANLANDAADEIERLRTALRFYATASKEDWLNDNGFNANAALA